MQKLFSKNLMDLKNKCIQTPSGEGRRHWTAQVGRALYQRSGWGTKFVDNLAHAKEK
jgi:hypothetical protein